MPAKDIKELRNAGKLEEAYAMAKAELDAAPDNLWAKRNISWVFYSQLDKAVGNLSTFISKLNELKALELPESEDMLYDNLANVIAKAARHIASQPQINVTELSALFHEVQDIPFKKPGLWYSVLFKAFHKGFKDTDKYLAFVDWWNFENFREEDYQPEKMPTGKEIMAMAEQAYIAYAKQLLPKQRIYDAFTYDFQKVKDFLPKLDEVIEKHPDYQYPTYYKAKLMLAIGETDKLLESFLPFAKRKRNDFWVWEVLSELFQDDEEKVLACHCRALTCNSPEEMLVGLRQKMADYFIRKGQFSEAKTEIEKLAAARSAKGWTIPATVKTWQNSDWYQQATAKKSNFDFYKVHAPKADDLLYTDVPEESILVTFVNRDKKMLNFLASEEKFGFFKYERFLDKVNVGDTLKVRFKNGSNDSIFQVYTVEKANDESLRKKYFKQVDGEVRIPEGKSFGFVNDVFLHGSLVAKNQLTNGMSIKGQAIKSYNPDKKQWGWKVIALE